MPPAATAPTKNNYTHRPRPAHWDWPTTSVGHHNTTVRAGYGIYYVREDVGTADQISFQAPLSTHRVRWRPGRMPRHIFFCHTVARLPDSAMPMHLPAAGTLGSDFVPCLGAFARASPAATPSGCIPDLWLLGHWSGRGCFTVHLRTSRSQKICRTQHPAMEPHCAALARTQTGFLKSATLALTPFICAKRAQL